MTAFPFRRLRTLCLDFCVSLVFAATIGVAFAQQSYAADGTTEPAVSLEATTEHTEPPTTFATTCVNDGQVIATLSAGEATFTNSSEKSVCVGIASYERPSDDIEDQILFDWQYGEVPPHGTLRLSVNLPQCNYQLDAFRGQVITSFKGGVRYANGNRLLAYRLQSSQSWCGTTTTTLPTTTTTLPTTTTTTEVPTQLIPPISIVATTTTTVTNITTPDTLPVTGFNPLMPAAVALLLILIGLRLKRAAHHRN